MLPNQAYCKQRIGQFQNQYPASPYDVFWNRRVRIESQGESVLDDANIAATAKALTDMLSGWGRMGRTGVPSGHPMTQLLTTVRPFYQAIAGVALGSGMMPTVRPALAACYSSLVGVTNQSSAYPDSSGGDLFVAGKSKALMLLWGQTPGFDSKVRRGLKKMTHPLHPTIGERRWSAAKFCDVLEELDRWVQAWPSQNGGFQFKNLYPGLPIGRIVDIVYWT